ncbi:aminotransferase class IV [Telmatospirillum sp. J64-1]|uniref:aminotransferase class IV n=1 Tax=Telmatospirillum sp. J64-1 TaxID=2502183 RepID=UPI00115EC288|nr:aminotransferase class IV [Telmatospirillum sp. J64-1]
MKLFLNGAILPLDEAFISPTDRGFALGDGLFETIRAAEARPLRIRSHLTRLREGAKCLGISLTLTDGELINALGTTLEVNGLTEGVLRLTLSRGPAARGLLPPAHPHPTLLITAGPLPPPAAPARAAIAQDVRRNEHSPLSRFKTLSYLDNVLARMEAERRGADEALLLNTAGRLAESTIANLFLVIDGDVVTPPVSEGALPGVMRADVMDRLGAATARLTLHDLAAASEAFLTNSLGIRPLIEVDGRPVGTGQMGPVTRRLMEDLG